MTIKQKNRFLISIFTFSLFFHISTIVNFIAFILNSKSFNYSSNFFESYYEVLAFYLILMIFNIFLFVLTFYTIYIFKSFNSKEGFYTCSAMVVSSLINFKSFLLNYSLYNLPDTFYASAFKSEYIALLSISLFIFISIMYTFIFDNSNVENYIFYILIGTILVGILMPVDYDSIGKSLHYKSSVETSIVISYIAISLTSVLFYFLDFKINSYKENIILGTSLFFVLLSLISFTLSNNLIVMSIFMLIYLISNFIYASKIHKIYVWK